DDRVVREVLLAHAAGGEEGELDLEFRGAACEGARRGQLAPGAETARLPQAGELVGRFGGAGVVQVADEMWRIDGGHAPGGGDLGQGITQVCRAPEVVRQEASCLIQVAARADVEMPG